MRWQVSAHQRIKLVQVKCSPIPTLLIYHSILILLSIIDRPFTVVVKVLDT